MTEIGLLLYLIGGICFTFLSSRSVWSSCGYRPRQNFARLVVSIALWPLAFALPKLISELGPALLDSNSLAFRHRCVQARDALQRMQERRSPLFVPESLLTRYESASKFKGSPDGAFLTISASCVLAVANGENAEEDEDEDEGRPTFYYLLILAENLLEREQDRAREERDRALNENAKMWSERRSQGVHVTVSDQVACRHAPDFLVSCDLAREFESLPPEVRCEVESWLRFVGSRGFRFPSSSNSPPSLPMYAGLPIVRLKNCALVYEFNGERQLPMVLGIIWQG